MNIGDGILDNILHPPVLFFLLGIFAVLVKSDLEIPAQISKFLSLYLLFDIGIKGGEELFHSGFTLTVMKVMGICVLLSFLIPFICFQILKRKVDVYNAGAIAASYGSISAVTFITASSFLEAQHIPFSGYMVAGMALMESPAIIAGLLIIKASLSDNGKSKNRLGKVFHEAFTNGSVLLLVGSLVIGYLAGNAGEAELKPFVGDIFKGMLSLYMLDMGIVAGNKLSSLKENGGFLSLFSVVYPSIAAIFAIFIAKSLGLSVGNALLLTILVASGSYIAVPAAMRLAVPQVNMSFLLPMTLGGTFMFNIIFGIPLYYFVIEKLWN